MYLRSSTAILLAHDMTVVFSCVYGYFVPSTFAVRHGLRRVGSPRLNCVSSHPSVCLPASDNSNLLISVSSNKHASQPARQPTRPPPPLLFSKVLRAGWSGGKTKHCTA
ncbi:hypothetical protein LX32DRAFT_192933 [Colletotrichum zoysiae]|uniref:Uncharacterized protein n=1 Tax=Colletotrichum zoysiae TaxID=1216348 RepID=A0AAD9LY75_9PEZI|nr:hypothetical protein LX32DRAFT_192933 [Colletotrichum zoysiae]